MNDNLHNLVQRNEIIRLLENADARNFISKHLKADVFRLSMNRQESALFDQRTALSLIQVYVKAALKIPLWVDKMLAVNKQSLEQATSQRVAVWKKDRFGGIRLLELTGGLGVDSTFMSESFGEIVSLENEVFLHDLSSYNDMKLGLKNITRIRADAGDWQRYHKGADTTVYVDPDRRPNGRKRVNALSESAPPVLEWLGELHAKSASILIKCSPMEDITALKRTVPSLHRIYCVAHENEMKEILLELRADTREPGIIAVDISAQGIFELQATELDLWEKGNIVREGRFILEPSVAVRKAGLGPMYAGQLGLGPAGDQGDYYLSDTRPEGFSGRIWDIEAEGRLNWRMLRGDLKGRGIGRLHVLRKHFPMSSETIRKKLGVEEGGDHYLILVMNKEGGSRFYLGSRC